MVNFSNKDKIIIEWTAQSYHFTDSAKKEVAQKFAKKYGVSVKQIEVITHSLKRNEKGESIDFAKQIVDNIQDPKYQQHLFTKYLKLEHPDEVYDWKFITDLDNELNLEIKYDKYERRRTYKIDYVKWSNFLSYGEDNYIDLNELKGLVLINSNPGNQGGKTNFGIDLFHFLLFGVTSKYKKLEQLFNKNIDCKEFYVEGGIEVAGEKFKIKRTVKRAKKKDGTWGATSQEVRYFQFLGGEYDELVDQNSKSTKNLQDEHSLKTNKVLLEVIGDEKDFDYIVSATGTDLGNLIKSGKTEKEKKINKWIGLEPITIKNELAKGRYNKFKQTLKSNIFSKENLKNDIEELKNKITLLENEVEFRKTEFSLLENTKTILEKEKEDLFLKRKPIDERISKLDFVSITERVKQLRLEYVEKLAKYEKEESELAEIGDIEFDTNSYTQKIKKLSDITYAIQSKRNEIAMKEKECSGLEKKTICPTCNQKVKNAEEFKKHIEEHKKDIVKLNSEIEELIPQEKIASEELNVLTKIQEKYKKKTLLEASISLKDSSLSSIIEKGKSEREKLQLIEDNKADVLYNNNIDLDITNIKSKINNNDYSINLKRTEIQRLEEQIRVMNKKISENEILIKEIEEELIKDKNWKLYLELVGNKGIIKMVLQEYIPQINQDISELLQGLCDFEIFASVNENNEIEFSISIDGVETDLSGASGMETTMAALAIRTVLSNVSTIPKPNFVTFDEILGTINESNYDSVKELFERIKSKYQFILHISHIDAIKSWHDQVITINKVNGISRMALK